MLHLDGIWNALKTIVLGPMTMEAVEKGIDQAAAKHPVKGLDPNKSKSIVDLRKVLGLDPSFEARKELAIELEFPGEYTGTADQNIKLFDATMERIAKRCLDVPRGG